MLVSIIHRLGRSPRAVRLLAVATAALGCLVIPPPHAAADAPAVSLEEGDRIVLVGNTFAERMQHFGYLETFLTLHHARLGLTFRNMGWSADEVSLQPRPMDFGDMDTHLTEQQASVILLSFGFNESFRGPAYLPDFIAAYTALVEHLAATSFDGRGPARPVVITPFTPEPLPGDLRSPEYPYLEAYTEAIRTMAHDLGVPVLDVAAWASNFEHEPIRLTFNGIHLTEYGDYTVARALRHPLGMRIRPYYIEVDAAAGSVGETAGVVVEEAHFNDDGTIRLAVRWDALPIPSPPGGGGMDEGLGVMVSGLPVGTYEVAWEGGSATERRADQLASRSVILMDTPAHAAAEALRALIIDKNQLFFDRWRAVNGFYIYGGRKQPFGIVSFPPEMSRFDQLVQQREQEIRERVQTPVRATLTIKAVAR